MRQSEIIGLVTVVLLGAGALTTGRHVAGALETAASSHAEQRLGELGFTEVEVAPDGLILEMRGRLRSDREREIAVAAVRETPDVSQVIDNLVVVAPLVDLRPAVLRLQKDDKALTLTGEAPNAEARDLLASRAALSNRGGELLNLMKAQDRRATDDWLEAAEAAIDAVSELRVGQALVERGVLKLEGAATDAEARDRIVETLRRRLGESVALELDVTSPPPFISPFEFVAAKTRAGIDLRLCHVPDAAARSVVLGDLKSLGGERAAAPGCIIANGVPNSGWTPAVQRGIAALKLVLEGEVRLRDDRVWVTGFLEKGADIEAVARAATADWPELYTVETDLREILPVVRPFAMTIVKNPGDVRLTGAAPSPEPAERWAERLDATNDLTLARGAPAGWTDAIDEVVEAVAELKIGSAVITDRAILLTAPGAPSELSRLNEELRNRLPPGFRVDVTAAREPKFLETTAEATPQSVDRAIYRFAARRAADGAVSLSGLVADNAARSVVTAYARAQLGGDSMEEALAAGDVAPPAGWRRAVFAVLEALAKLEEGDVSAEPGAVYLRGKTQDASGLREAVATLEQKTPDGFARFSRIVVDEEGEERDESAPEAVSADFCIILLNRKSSADPILFQSGSAAIGRESDATLDALAELLLRCQSARIEVGGHTDSQGTEEANLALSRERAASVRLSLLARGVEEGRLTSEGYGEAAPIASNETAEGRAKNRRIEFKLVDE